MLKSAYTLIVIIVLLLFSSLKGVAQVNFSSSNIPIVVINTNNRQIVDEPKIEAQMGVIYNGPGKKNYLNDSFNDYNGKIKIEIRGSSSQTLFPKKQYAFETIKHDGSNNNVSLLGLPAENDWILQAPYSDKSLIRNVLAYKLSESLGHYASRTKLCELVLNGEYMGVYVLMEKIKRDDNRVNIANLNPDETYGDDVSGGYIIKIDKTTGSKCSGWVSDIANIYFQYEYPKCDEIVAEQQSYIINYINELERALYAPYFKNPVKGYQNYLDINSLIDYFIINELSNNVDGYFFSTFLYKDKASNGGKLHFGPVWDYNIAFGNADFNDGYLTSGIKAANLPWWNRILQDENFNNRLKARWSELRQAQLSNDKVLNIIDSLVTVLQEPQERNFKRWGVLGNYVWPNYFIGPTYKSEINFLKGWIINRLNWLDLNLPGYSEGYQPYVDYEANVFPNPFDYFLTFVFTLEETSAVSILVYDSKGIKVKEYNHQKEYSEGKHKLVLNLNDGNGLPVGVYTVVFEVEGNQVLKERVVKKD